jgi:hypothetical protein
MNALMGVISDTLMKSIAEWPLEGNATMQTVRAFNKLFWLQNDLLNRHYINSTS